MKITEKKKETTEGSKAGKAINGNFMQTSKTVGFSDLSVVQYNNVNICTVSNHRLKKFTRGV